MCRYILCLQVVHEDGTAVIMNRMAGNLLNKQHQLLVRSMYNKAVPSIIRKSNKHFGKLGYGFARDLGTVTCVRVYDSTKLIGFFKKANSLHYFFNRQAYLLFVDLML